MPEAQVITIDAEKQLDKPVEITITGAGEGVTSFGATSIHVGHHTEATVVLKYVGSGTHADNVEFVLDDGAQVTVVEFLDQILPGMDGEIRKESNKIFKKQGFELRLSTKVTDAKVNGSAVTLTVEPAAGGTAETIEADSPGVFSRIDVVDPPYMPP